MPNRERRRALAGGLVKEIDALESNGVPVQDRLKISAACPLILPVPRCLGSGSRGSSRREQNWYHG